MFCTLKSYLQKLSHILDFIELANTRGRNVMQVMSSTPGEPTKRNICMLWSAGRILPKVWKTAHNT